MRFYEDVKSVKDSLRYPIMLILTDGAIHDMTQTRDVIYKLAELPCSVIVIGVGNADFSAMEKLDGDGVSLRNSAGKICKRDIVQFVRFNEAMSRGDLAGQVLKEVPLQLVSYMELNHIEAQPVQ